MVQEEQSKDYESVDVGSPPASLVEEVEGLDFEEAPDVVERAAEEGLNAGGPPAWLVEAVENSDMGLPDVVERVEETTEEALDAGGPPAWLVEAVEGDGFETPSSA